jgi:hypothetical protein
LEEGKFPSIRKRSIAADGVWHRIRISGYAIDPGLGYDPDVALIERYWM